MAYKRTRKSAAEEFTYKGNSVVKNPDFAPWNNWRNALWVQMIPLKLENQNSSGSGGSISIGGENRPTFAFLAPSNISENINHTWDGFDSIQSRLMGKIVAGAKLTEETKALYRTMNNVKANGLLNRSAVDGGGEVQSAHNAAVQAAGRISGTNVPRFKVDTPLRYMDSGRREVVLEFILMNSAKGVIEEGSAMGARGHGAVTNSRITEVTDIVKDLMMYSSPAIKNDSNIEYEFPYVWRLETAPNGFLLYEFCALTAVQPTWNAPYVNGHPTHCNLSLTFKDLSPLFRSTIKTGSAINVIDTSNVAEMTDAEWATHFEKIEPTTAKPDKLRALLDARTKFKRLQSIHKSIQSGNQESVLKYFGKRGGTEIRKIFDSPTQQKIGDAIPMGKNTPNMISRFPRL